MLRVNPKALLLCCILSVIALAPVVAQETKPSARPNFTGTWKLNLEKSNFGPTPAPESMVIKIDHKEPALALVATRVEKGSAPDTVILKLTTDGKESSNTVHGSEVKTKLKWEGPVLWLDSLINIDGGTVSLKDKWSLSADGTTLTIARHYSGPEGEADIIYVLERQ